MSDQIRNPEDRFSHNEAQIFVWRNEHYFASLASLFITKFVPDPFSCCTVTGETGDAKTSFTVNVSPVYGKCTVSPEQGVALEQDFRVHCTDWREFQVNYFLCLKFSDVIGISVDSAVYRGHKATKLSINPIRLP